MHVHGVLNYVFVFFWVTSGQCTGKLIKCFVTQLSVVFFFCFTKKERYTNKFNLFERDLTEYKTIACVKAMTKVGADWLAQRWLLLFS